MKTLNSDKSTFKKTGIKKEEQEVQCKKCEHYVEQENREQNKVTEQAMACEIYGYSEQNLRRECPEFEEKDESK